ncbi:MAG TPA: TatD family hydrolase, partial [Anaerolineales bacterium]|nr:TatD family hydrolase [Anaerolineales bacterium]
MLTDTHCHLDFNKFDQDRESVIERARQAGVSRLLIPALDLESSRSAIQLAEAHQNVYAAVGFHPTDLNKFSEKAFQEVQQLASHTKVVAVGEIGIDYYWVKKREERVFQVEMLRRQLDWASSIDKPVIVHMREQADAWFGQASVDLLNILGEWHRELKTRDHPLSEKPGVLHS